MKDKLTQLAQQYENSAQLDVVIAGVSIIVLTTLLAISGNNPELAQFSPFLMRALVTIPTVAMGVGFVPNAIQARNFRSEANNETQVQILSSF